MRHHESGHYQCDTHNHRDGFAASDFHNIPAYGDVLIDFGRRPATASRVA